jgi:hypothetical protein
MMNLGITELKASHRNTGLDDESASSSRGSVFLDIPFYRTAFSATGAYPPRSVSENFSLFCEICLKRNQVYATFRNHDQTIPHLPS